LINCSLLPLQCAELVVITLHFQQQQHKKAKELMSSCCIATEYYLRYPSTINRTRKKCVPCSKVERYDAAEERRQVAPRACPSAHRGIHRLDRLSFLRIVSADCSAGPAMPRPRGASVCAPRVRLRRLVPGLDGRALGPRDIVSCPAGADLMRSVAFSLSSLLSCTIVPLLCTGACRNASTVWSH
jgi:hypothetical protein